MNRGGRRNVLPEAIYLAFAIALTLLFRFRTDRDGWVTILAYGPRWVWLLPLAIFAWRSRQLAVPRLILTVVVSLLAFFGIMNLQVPVHAVFRSASINAFSLRVFSCNLNGAQTEGRKLDASRFQQLVQELQPDVVCLQEWNATTTPIQWPPGWHILHDHSLLIASRLPQRRVAALTGSMLGGEGSILQSQLKMGGRYIDVFDAHLETPRRGFDSLLAIDGVNKMSVTQSLRRRQNEAENASAWIRHQSDSPVVAGDFNMIDGTCAFQDSWGWLVDSFSTAGWGFGNTHRLGLWGVRIDHILSSRNGSVKRCWVARDVGSDHLPLVADLRLRR